MNRKHSRLALVGVLALAASVTVGLAGTAAEGAKKKKSGNKARTFQNGTQFLIPDDPPGASFPGQLDATIKIGKSMEGQGGRGRRRRHPHHPPRSPETSTSS